MVDMWLYEDFKTHSADHGVYKHNRGQPNGGHTLILLGWGTDDKLYNPPRDYWIVQNQWGSDWGEEGYARIQIGDVSGIDTWAIGCSPV